MKNTSKIAAIALVVLMGTPTAFAQTTSGENTTGTAPTGIRQNKEALSKQAEEARNRAKQIASTTKNELKQKMENARQVASTTRNGLKQKAEDAREQIQNKREELQKNLEARKIELLKQWGEKTIKRLEEATMRLDRLATRIESRIAKMKANKIDTGTADASLVVAKQKIADAKTTLSAAKLAIADIANQSGGTITASTTKNILAKNLPKIKEQTRIVNEALKAAHKALVQTITELKGKEGVKKGTATSTKPTEED